MFLYGSQMGWFSLSGEVGTYQQFMNSSNQDSVSFLKKLSNFKSLATNYIVYGRYMKPISLENKVPLILSLLSYYPSVMVSAWKELEEDNSLALFIGNANGKEAFIDVSFNLDLSLYGFQNSHLPITVYSVNQNGTSSLFTKLNSLLFSFHSSVPKRDLLFLKFTSTN